MVRRRHSSSTFSTCFWRAFLPAPGGEYAEAADQRINASWQQGLILVNTGWNWRPVRKGNKFSIPTTRGIIAAIQSGRDRYRGQHLRDNLDVPRPVPGVDRAVEPTQHLGWTSPRKYDAPATALAYPVFFRGGFPGGTQLSRNFEWLTRFVRLRPKLELRCCCSKKPARSGFFLFLQAAFVWTVCNLHAANKGLKGAFFPGCSNCC